MMRTYIGRAIALVCGTIAIILSSVVIVARAMSKQADQQFGMPILYILLSIASLVAIVSASPRKRTQ